MVAALLATVGAGLQPGLAVAQSSDRHAALIVDGNNGAVLHADRADEPRYPASLTKMMTIYLAFEAIEQGRASYSTRIKVSHEAASQPPTKLDLDPGETIALGDAIKALITKSANDVAVAVAEHFGGTEARFARMMTDKARLFGMSRTTFRNASGLPDPGQVTTARDMVRLALRLQDDFPRHYHLFSTRAFAYDGSTYRNHNNLLHRFQGTDGIKTGYTRASGFNLVSSVRRGGRHVVGAVMGGRTAGRRDDAMQLLLSRALMQSSPYKTRKPAPVLVAVASPAHRPAPAVRPEPMRAPPAVVAAAPQPVPAVRPRPAPKVAQVVKDTPPPRPVMVPPRPRQAVPRQPVVEAAPQIAVAPPPPSPQPPSLQPQRALPDLEVPPLAQALAAPASAAGQPSSEVARAPSTLGEQAAGFDPQRFSFGASRLQTTAAAMPPASPVDATPGQHQSPAVEARPPPVRVQTVAVKLPPPGAPLGGSPTKLVIRGAAPSSLEQQAASLDRSRGVAAAAPAQAPPPVQAVPVAVRPQPLAVAPYGVRGPMPPPQQTAVTGSGFEVQIGAYQTSGEAERALQSTRASAGDLLKAHQPRAVAVKKDQRQIYRARFTGFDSRTAASTCIELRRRQIDCFVMRAE